jgi:hypothetical protein
MRLPGASCLTSATRRTQPRKIQICPYSRQVLKQALRVSVLLAAADGMARPVRAATVTGDAGPAVPPIPR